VHGCCHQRRKAILIGNITSAPTSSKVVEPFSNFAETWRLAAACAPAYHARLGRRRRSGTVDKGIALNREARTSSSGEMVMRAGGSGPMAIAHKRSKIKNCNAAGKMTRLLNTCIGWELYELRQQMWHNSTKSRPDFE